MPADTAAKLVVVEDEEEIRALVADYLRQDGYDVRCCAGGDGLDEALGAGPADLVVLDVSMPGEDGLSIARRLRRRSKTPIIMLTARDELVDRIVGLEVGADDYLTKPFDLRELRARVRALLRRAATTTAPEPATPGEGGALIPFGKVRLSLDERCLFDRDDAVIALTANEFDMLAALARNPNRVLSRGQLLDVALRPDDAAYDRAIDIRVARLRKKIELDPAKPQVIKTVRNAGYVYVPPPEERHARPPVAAAAAHAP